MAPTPGHDGGHCPHDHGSAADGTVLIAADAAVLSADRGGTLSDHPVPVRAPAPAPIRDLRITVVVLRRDLSRKSRTLPKYLDIEIL
jgi:hypothetical protein